MTGRNSSISVSTNLTHSPNSAAAMQKHSCKRTSSSNSSGGVIRELAATLTKEKQKTPASSRSNFDLKEALSSARRSFEKGMSSKTTSRKRPMSALNNPTSFSPGVSTRSSTSSVTLSNLSASSYTRSPKKSPKKSSSAPASPVKAYTCNNSSRTNQCSPSNKRLKIAQVNSGMENPHTLRSNLLLMKADEGTLGETILPIAAPTSSFDMDSDDVIINLPSPPRHAIKKCITNSPDSAKNSKTTCVVRDKQRMHISTPSELPAHNDPKVPLDVSFAGNGEVSNKLRTSHSPALPLSPKAPVTELQIPKSPGRMLLSDSKRQTSKDLSKNKPVRLSMNEVIKLHQDEGVMHLLHGLSSSRRANSVKSAVSATVVRRRASNEFTQAAMLQQAQAQAAQGKASRGYPAEKRSASFKTTNSFNSRSLSAGYGRLQHRPRPHQHSQGSNSLFSPLSHIKPCTLDELMSPKNLEILKQLPTKDYARLRTSPTRYILQEQPPQHLMANNLPNHNRLNHQNVSNLSNCVQLTSATSASLNSSGKE